MDWREKLRLMTRLEDEDESQHWHAVFVMTGDEDPVKEKIEYALGKFGVRVLVPKRRIKERKAGRWHERIKPLLPGYILLQGKIDIQAYYKLKTVPGIVRILKGNRGLYRIYPDEIEIISRLMVDGEIIGASVAFKQGDKIIITDGPLLNMEGMITSFDQRRGRARVRLSILGDERTVDLGITFIESA